jgi:hypothetical protein
VIEEVIERGSDRMALDSGEEAASGSQRGHLGYQVWALCDNAVDDTLSVYVVRVVARWAHRLHSMLCRSEPGPLFMAIAR